MGLTTFIRFRGIAAAALAAAALSACSYFEDDEVILAGERIPVRVTPDERLVTPGEANVEISPAQSNADWTHPNGNPQHALGHVAGPGSLGVAWRASLGTGGTGLTATPVVAESRVYGMDAGATVSAFSTGGALAWRAELTPEGEDPADGFGGGLAYAGGRIFAATGFGEVVALDAASGNEIWRQKMTAPVRSAPAVQDGVVVAVARDNTALAFNADDGTVRWRVTGAASTNAGVLGGASPAISPGGVAILPFASGELVAVRATSGQRLWTDVVSGGRRGFARSAISDISADPVIQGVAVIAGNQSGQLVAIDGRNGRRGWTREFGARDAVWVDGATLYLVTDAAEVKRLSSQDGGTLWSTPLPEYDDPEDREDAIGYGGPVLAGGRLLVTSSDGAVIAFDPQSGAEVARALVDNLRGLGPVVAGNTVYVVTSGGDLVALR